MKNAYGYLVSVELNQVIHWVALSEEHSSIANDRIIINLIHGDHNSDPNIHYISASHTTVCDCRPLIACRSSTLV